MNKKLKNIICLMLSAVILLNTFVSSLPVVDAALNSQNGTNLALGSPVMNANFTADNWNPDETYIWGIFLSNFCTPLVDTYETAFTSTGTGSNGAGFKALGFGVGSNPESLEILKNFCSYAITQQAKSGYELYVTYNYVSGNGIVRVDPNATSEEYTDYMRPASFKDLLIVQNTNLTNDLSVTTTAEGYPLITPTASTLNGEEAIKTSVSDESVVYTSTYETSNLDYSSNYHDMASSSGFLPTFWIKMKQGNKFVKVLDYTNSYDVQIFSLILNKFDNKDVLTNFADLYDKDTIIKLDCFGNIVTSDNRMVIPASTNQNLTETKKINLVNSFFLNSSTVKTNNKDRMMYNTKQYNDKAEHSVFASMWNYSGVLTGEFTSLGQIGNFPAISNVDTPIQTGSTYVYYDLDSIAFSNKNNVKYGDMVLQLFDKSISGSNAGNIKIETVNNFGKSDWIGASTGFEIEGDYANALLHTSVASSILANTLISQGGDNSKSEIIDEILTPDGEATDLFSTPIVINVALDTGYSGDISGDNSEGVKEQKGYRKLFNFLYEGYISKKTVTGSNVDMTLDRNYVTNALKGVEVGEVNTMLQTLYDGFTIVDAFLKENGEECSINESKLPYNESNSRLILLYPISDILASLADTFALAPGTEFATYSAYIYMTYLDFYGMSLKSINGAEASKSSELNKDIFNDDDIDNFNFGDAFNLKSEADMKSEILNYTYMMLEPNAGRDYRTEMVNNFITDFLYNTYINLCYDDGNEGGVSTASGNFLNIPTFAENFITKPIINKYADIASILIMVGIALIVVMGVIKGREPLWFMMTLFMLVNTILITPSTGELIPYVTTNVVEAFFQDHMTFWSISEAIGNATTEQKAASNANNYDLSDEEYAEYKYLYGLLNTNLNLDKTLTVKKDISSKMVQELNGIYSDIQNIQSARWLIPLVMEQFSSEDSSEDYLNSPLSSLMTDNVNCYWYYNNLDAENTNTVSPTLTSGQDATHISDVMTDKDESAFLNNVTGKYYLDFVSLYTDDNNAIYNYQSSAYDEHDSSNYELYHTYSYILKDLDINGLSDIVNSDDYSGIDDFYTAATNEYKDKTFSAVNEEWVNTLTNIENYADSYQRYDRSTVQQLHSFLQATETPYQFFYGNVKESFKGSASLGYVISELQGQIEYDINGKEVRKSFMHAEYNDGSTTYPTGYTKDICDLQNLITNMVPYLYYTSIYACGEDGESGILVNSVVNRDGTVTTEPIKISENYSIYEGQNASWLFRCNWAIKLMENKEYSEPQTIKDSEGNKYIVKHPMVAECYPENRPMIFSEAQMYAEGLNESDLSTVELKCLKVNEEVEQRWTLLVNYVGISNLTYEVLARQMALECLLVFNDVFSPSTVINTSHSMYPQSIDISNVSFDSVMKMLMLNASSNTNYITDNTMKSVIGTCGWLIGLAFLIVTLLSTVIIPLIRDILMAGVFLLGFWSMLRIIFASNTYKMKVACGQFLCNVTLTIMNICYYGVFYLMLSATSNDEVLSMNTIRLEAGNPWYIVLILFVVDIVYIICCWLFYKFLKLNYVDMGGMKFRELGLSAKNKLNRGIEKMKNSITKSTDNISSTIKSGRDQMIKGKNKIKQSASDFWNYDGTKKSSSNTESSGSNSGSSNNKSNTKKDTSTSKSYVDDSTTSQDARESSKINDAIERGSKKRKKDKSKEDDKAKKSDDIENKKENESDDKLSKLYNYAKEISNNK